MFQIKNKNWIKLLKIFFLLLFVLTVSNGLFDYRYHVKNKYMDSSPRIKNGVLALDDMDLVGEDCIYLIDDWEFYKDALLTPTDFMEQSLTPDAYVFIGQYPDFSFNNAKNSIYGSATYRIRLLNKGSEKLVSLQIPEVFSAYKLWVDGELLAQCGDIATTSYAPFLKSNIVNFQLDESSEIIFAVSNYSHYYSGIWYIPSLGTATTVTTLYTQKIIRYLFLTLVPFTIGLLSLLVWGFKKNTLNLYFCMMCFSFSLFVSYPLVYLNGTTHATFYYILEDLALLSFLFFSMKINFILNKITVNSKLRSIFYSLLLVVFGLVLLYPLCPLRGNLKFTLFYGTFIDTYKYFTCTFLISSSIYGIFKGQTDSFSLLFANLLYALSVTRNMAYANQYEPTTTIWENELSGMIFIIIIALILIKNLFQVINEYGILQNHLMEEVESRTIEVTNLLIERKTLLSNMMHDLKSPVSAIQAFVELISTDTNLQNPKLKEYLTNIQQKSTLMQNRILSFQNVTLEDEVNLKKEVLWVNQLLSEIHELYLPDTDASGIYFSMTPLSSDVKIMGYPNRLYTLFENLIYNAISFTSLNGTISLCASITQNQVTIQLSDTGVGISPDILPNIFNRQYTNRTTESSSLSGSGIGLHIVASIVKEHRGSLSVKSSLGVGTTFSISIPIYK